MTPRTLPQTEQLPRALYTAKQVQGFDRLAIGQFGVPGLTLMERAGKAAFDLMRKRWPQASRVTVLAGTGNNGGDGFVVARLARDAGLQARVLQMGDPQRLGGDAAENAERWRASGGEWRNFEKVPEDSELIVDALLGTGLERAVDGAWAQAIAAANSHRAPCLAIDLPSGLHADTGAVLGTAIRAEATISFIGLKLGLFTGEGPACTGEIFFDGLEVPAAVFASSVLTARRIDWASQLQGFRPRSRTAHKGHFGHVLVVGGNHGMGGAARLAAEAALRVGSGRVSLATRPCHVSAVLAARPEVMVHGLEDPHDLRALLRQASVVVIGPGLGQDDWATGLWAAAYEADRPLVVDADALRLLATEPAHRDDWVLTPHPGEAAALLAICTAELNTQRHDTALQLQRRYGGSIVLKGAGSIVASAGSVPAAVCSDGNPGMASAGMGDVLSGVIGGLLAQGFDIREAAESGVCAHAAAADRAALESGERGLLAGDVIDCLRGLVNSK